MEKQSNAGDGPRLIYSHYRLNPILYRIERGMPPATIPSGYLTPYAPQRREKKKNKCSHQVRFAGMA